MLPRCTLIDGDLERVGSTLAVSLPKVEVKHAEGAAIEGDSSSKTSQNVSELDPRLVQSTSHDEYAVSIQYS